MTSLAQKWEKSSVAPITFNRSIRLRIEVDRGIADIQKKFPHLTQTQIINDLLQEGIDNFFRTLPKH